MSAWIVNKIHIDRMLATAMAWELVKPTEATRIGRMLWVENLNSVAYRYPYDGSGERPGPIDLRDSDIRSYVCSEATPLSPDEALKASHCYDYQSCEHPEWDDSAAKRFNKALEIEAVKRGANESSPAYNAAPWGIR